MVSGISSNLNESEKVFQILRIDIVIIISCNANFIDSVMQKIEEQHDTKNILLIIPDNLLRNSRQLKSSARCQIVTFNEKIDKIDEKISILTQKRLVSCKKKNVDLINSITGREKEILHLVKKGKTNREIASELFLSIKTVENHRTNILKKTKSKSMLTLINELYNLGLFEF